MHIGATTIVQSGASFEDSKATLFENLGKLLEPFEKTLAKQGPFLLGSKVFYCDFPLYHHLSNLSLLSIDFLKRYPFHAGI